MKRRHFLAACWVALAAPVLAARPDVRTADFEMEKLIAKAQLLAYESAEHYQLWRNGAVDSPKTLQALEPRLQSLTQIEQKVALLSQVAALRKWSRQQKQEVKLLIEDVKSPTGLRRTLTELQQRWRGAVEMQQSLLEGRRVQLPLLISSGGTVEQRAFYQWKASLLDVLQSELTLCQELAMAFEAGRAAPELEEKALALFGRVRLIRPPQICQAAHQCYEQRFTALKRLSESAQSMTDPDMLSNLKYAEGEYRRLALICEQASLAAQARVLGLSNC